MNEATYTRNDLAAAISANHTECSFQTGRGIVDTVIKELSAALTKGSRVEFRDFGVLQVVKRRSKIGRNPKKPDAGTFKVPARNVVKFRTGRGLDAKLNA